MNIKFFKKLESYKLQNLNTLDRVSHNFMYTILCIDNTSGKLNFMQHTDLPNLIANSANLYLIPSYTLSIICLEAIHEIIEDRKNLFYDNAYSNEITNIATETADIFKIFLRNSVEKYEVISQERKLDLTDAPLCSTK